MSFRRNDACARARAHAPSSLALLILSLAFLAACGGGGGGGDGSPTVIPTVPTATSTPGLSVAPTPTATPVTPVRLTKVLEVGDSVNRAEVRAIEEAALAEDGSIALILGTEAGTERKNAVHVRSADGKSIRSVFDESNAPADVDLETLGRLRVADGGFTFQTGDGLDSDRLYLASGASVVPLAGLEPGVASPGFRILGDVRVGAGPIVAFSGGGETCTVETVADETRTRCTNHLYVADASGAVHLVTGFDADLSDESTSGVRVAVNDAGVAWFSVSGRGSEDALIRVENRQTRSILRADTSIPGTGVVTRPQVIDATSDERLLITGSLPPETDGGIRPGVLGVLASDGSSLTEIARTGEGAEPFSEIRPVGVADNGHVLFQARIGTPADGVTLPRTLQLGNGSQTVEILREGLPLEPGGPIVLTLRESRFNRSGDLVFVADLGTRDGTTVRIDEVRLVSRPAGSATLETLASTLQDGDLGAFTAFRIAGLDDAGHVLVTGVRSRSSDRILMIGPVAAGG